MHDVIFFNNSFIKRNKCKIDAMSPSAQFGINVFEGIRGYFNKSRYIFRLYDHLDRLSRSLDEINIKFNLDYVHISETIKKLLDINGCKTNFSIRIIIYLGLEGTWSDIEKGQILIAGVDNFDPPKNPININSAAISKFNRISNNQMPAFIKSGANYLNSRYALLEVQKRGFQEAILLNESQNISETPGANIFFVVKNKLITPSTDQSILDGITRDTIIKIAKKNKIQVEERPISINEISSFDEAFLCGSASEIKSIKKINNHHYNKNSTTNFLFDQYKLAVTNKNYNSFNWCTTI